MVTHICRTPAPASNASTLACITCGGRPASTQWSAPRAERQQLETRPRMRWNWVQSTDQAEACAEAVSSIIFRTHLFPFPSFTSCQPVAREKLLPACPAAPAPAPALRCVLPRPSAACATDAARIVCPPAPCLGGISNRIPSARLRTFVRRRPMLNA